jgi:NADH-quinone oxidoreductase subunit M
VATIGVLATTFYALRLVQRAFQGPNVNHWHIRDLIPREGIMMGLLIVTLLWLGLYPQPILNMFNPTLTHLEEAVSER